MCVCVGYHGYHVRATTAFLVRMLESLKTMMEKIEEEAMIQELVELVEKRNALVQQLEEERVRSVITNTATLLRMCVTLGCHQHNIALCHREEEERLKSPKEPKGKWR